MREILFRGKRKDNGEWIKGDLLQYLAAGKMHIVGYCLGAGGVEVIPETVGQYTELDDKNSTKIFEGDIIKSKEYGKQHGDKNFSGYDIFEVRFVDGSFVIRNSDRLFYLLCGPDKEVIGNIHDNPDLLKGGAEE